LNAALALLVASIVSATGDGGEHLLAGARFFREGRFGEALVEFRVADGLGAEGARGYVAASLVKLERFEEALEAFDGLPLGEDSLLDFYRALACYGAQLYGCADAILASVGGGGGPKILAEVAGLRREIAARHARRPGEAEVAWYAGRCAELGAQRRAVLARAYCQERAALEARLIDPARAAPDPARNTSRGDRP